MIQEAIQPAAPDNWPEALAIIISSLLSWWLSRKTNRRGK